MFDNEKKKAAGTAQETVGQPGTQIPITANNKNKEPNEIYKRYEEQLISSLNQIREIDEGFDCGINSNQNFFISKIKLFMPRFLKNLIRRFI